MFNRELKKRIKNLERIAEAERQRQQCAAGFHKWELLNGETRIPWIRCSVCWDKPPKVNP